MTEDELVDAVRSAAARPEVGAAVGRVYADLQRAIDARRPACSMSGRCCRFEEYGHRLYVTTLELAAFVGQLPEHGRGGLPLPVGDNGRPPASPWDGTGCPFQVQGLCGVHAIRPFGCRMFFCDPTATGWQNEQYERVHADLKRLHVELNVPYHYVEWRHALRVLALAPTLPAHPPR